MMSRLKWIPGQGAPARLKTGGPRGGGRGRGGGACAAGVHEAGGLGERPRWAVAFAVCPCWARPPPPYGGPHAGGGPPGDRDLCVQWGREKRRRHAITWGHIGPLAHLVRPCRTPHPGGPLPDARA